MWLRTYTDIFTHVFRLSQISSIKKQTTSWSVARKIWKNKNPYNPNGRFKNAWDLNAAVFQFSKPSFSLFDFHNKPLHSNQAVNWRFKHGLSQPPWSPPPPGAQGAAALPWGEPFNNGACLNPGTKSCGCISGLTLQENATTSMKRLNLTQVWNLFLREGVEKEKKREEGRQMTGV